MSNFSYHDNLEEHECSHCGAKFIRHKESGEVNVCLSCYEDQVVQVRSGKDTAWFVVKMVFAALLIVWAFFSYTYSKRGGQAKLTGLIESMAAAGAGIWLGKSAIDKYKMKKKQ